MVRLQIRWCRHCAHKVALRPKGPTWWHFTVGRGYFLTLNCMANAGSTKTGLDLGSFCRGQFRCDCVAPERKPGKPQTTRWVLA